MAENRGMDGRDWARLLLLGAIWGGSFFFAAVAVRQISPLMLVFLRVSLAAATLWIYLVARGFRFAPMRAYALPFLGLALLNNVIPHTLMFTGQTAIGAGLASVLNATTPFWTMLLAHLLVAGDRLTPRRTLGVITGIVGTAVLVGPGLFANLGGPIWAKLALIGTAVSYAFATIYARRFTALPPELVATGQLTAATAITIPLVLMFDDPAALLSADLQSWIAVGGLAFLATALGYVLYFSLIASAGPSNTSLVTLIVPVSAIMLGAVFLGERIEFFEIAGMALISIGLLVIDGRLFRR